MMLTVHNTGHVTSKISKENLQFWSLFRDPKMPSIVSHQIYCLWYFFFLDIICKYDKFKRTILFFYPIDFFTPHVFVPHFSTALSMIPRSISQSLHFSSTSQNPYFLGKRRIGICLLHSFMCLVFMMLPLYGFSNSPVLFLSFTTAALGVRVSMFPHLATTPSVQHPLASSSLSAEGQHPSGN